jgi:hypothetical protein
MEDLLVWSKSQMEQFSLSTENIQVDQLLDDIALLHQPFADDRKVTLKPTRISSGSSSATWSAMPSNSPRRAAPSRFPASAGTIRFSSG